MACRSPAAARSALPPRELLRTGLRYSFSMLLRFGIVALVAAAAGATDLTPAERQANIDSFEYVWKTVRDRHWEAKPGGLDWQAVHDELRPRVEKAASKDEARDVIAAMLGRLHQTHFGVFPSEVYQDFESPGAGDGQTGIDVRVIDGHAIVTGVDADSPAAAKGVKPGSTCRRKFRRC